MTTTQTARVQNFRIENGNLYAPVDYMQKRGNARLDKMLSGKDELFNSTLHLSPSVEIAICVWLQTDYAAYLGELEAESWMRH